MEIWTLVATGMSERQKKNDYELNFDYVFPGVCVC